MRRAGWIVGCAWCLFSVGAFGAPALAQSTPVPAREQVVYLKSGAAVHGTLVERNPHSGAVLRLQSQQERIIPNEQIAYIGVRGSGGLHIDALEPGEVSIDRVPMGHTPLDLANLDPGDHLLEIDYDAGESASVHAAVYAGAIGHVTLPGAKLREVGRLREGAKAVLGGGLFIGISLGKQYVMGGAGLAGGLNFGLSARSDLRWLGHIQLGSVGGRLWFEVASSASLRLNLSSVYSMELGARVSIMPEPDIEAAKGYAAVARPSFGVQGSLLSLRLGAQRSQELTLWHALQWSPAADRPAFQTGVSLLHVWL